MIFDLHEEDAFIVTLDIETCFSDTCDITNIFEKKRIQKPFCGLFKDFQLPGKVKFFKCVKIATAISLLF